MTLRSLLALKGRLWWRGIPVERRVATIALLSIFALAAAPLWLGAASLAFTGVRTLGAPALMLTFAGAQAAWVVLVLIMNAWGEAFDLRRMLRFPIHPRTLHLSSVVMSVTELPALFVLPALSGAVLGAAARGGPLAGVAAALAVLLLAALTAALLQLLLALVSAMRHHRMLRLLHEGLATVVGMSGYLVYLGARDRVQHLMEAAGPTLPARLEHLARLAERALPTAAWPAWLATGALEGRWLHAAIGAGLALALLALLIECGWRLAHRLALGRETTSSVRAPRERAAGAPGGPRPWRRLLPAPLALLLEREVTLARRGPQMFAMLVFSVFVAVMFRAMAGRDVPAMGPWVAMMLSMQVQGFTGSLFGQEREGLRLLFLLPLESRALLLAKDLAVSLQFAVCLGVTLVGLTVANGDAGALLCIEVVVWGAALMLVGMMMGHVSSIQHPARADRRGRTSSGASVLSNLVHTIALFATLGAFALARWGARALAPPDARTLAGVLVPGALVLALAVAWWRSLAPAGRMLDGHRESMLAVIATPTETG